MSGSRSSSVAALGALNVAWLALFVKGLRPASLRRAGHLEHPKVFSNIDVLIKFYNFLFFVVLFVKKRPATQLTLAAAQQQ